MATPKFPAGNRSFHSDLKKRVQYYFDKENIPTSGDYRLFSKAVILIGVMCFLYIHLVFFSSPAWVTVLECVLLGGVIASIGFNIMHDGAHGSFSKYKILNSIAAFSLNILGGSSFMWNVKHNIIHHAYTNVDGVDDDIDVKPWLRMSATQKKYKLHRFQHIYFWFLYCLLYIFWIFVSDYRKYFTRKIGDIPLKKMSLKDHIVFWTFKLINIFLYIGLPIYVVGFNHWLTGYLIVTLFAGLILSVVFQLAHTVEDTSFPVPDADSGKMEDEWAIHQLKTTANFATQNKIICWFVGGLNFQIEHHLFPKISHVHYPAISRIIKETCKEYGVTYIEYHRMHQAVASHISHLKMLGKAA